jgi:glucosamine-6-phosphate deaminase
MESPQRGPQFRSPLSAPALSSLSLEASGPVPGWNNQLEVLPDAEHLSAAVADALLDQLLFPQARPLGLATGRTVVAVYAALRQRIAALAAAERARLLAGWRSFNLDDYVGLPRHDPRSFAAEMEARLITPLGLAPERVALPDGLAADPHAEAERYSAALQAAGGIGLQLLGLGNNGHVGFNEPPCEASQRCHVVELDAATRAQNAAAFGGDPEAVPRRAITLGLAEILAAEQILLVVSGGAKAPILKRLLQEPANAQLPASWLQHHPRLRLMVDRAALAG